MWTCDWWGWHGRNIGEEDWLFSGVEASANSVPPQYNISIAQFAHDYVGGPAKPGWLFGTTTKQATYTYNPQAYLDIYYLISPTGIVMLSGPGLISGIQSILQTVR